MDCVLFLLFYSIIIFAYIYIIIIHQGILQIVVVVLLFLNKINYFYVLMFGV